MGMGAVANKTPHSTNRLTALRASELFFLSDLKNIRLSQSKLGLRGRCSATCRIILESSYPECCLERVRRFDKLRWTAPPGYRIDSIFGGCVGIFLSSRRRQPDRCPPSFSRLHLKTLWSSSLLSFTITITNVEPSSVVPPSTSLRCPLSNTRLVLISIVSRSGDESCGISPWTRVD